VLYIKCTVYLKSQGINLLKRCGTEFIIGTSTTTVLLSCVFAGQLIETFDLVGSLSTIKLTESFVLPNRPRSVQLTAHECDTHRSADE
jgi:hypothetical protein